MKRRAFLALLPAAIVSAVALSSIDGFAAAKPPVFTGLIDGVGAGGYDVVAYFNASAATQGSPDITATHDGVTYRFASNDNRDLFTADPARYLPQYGGYCAYAVSQGYTAKIDPEAWTVVDGKLYLNFNRSVRSRWERDIPGYITSADANWPAVLDK